MNWHATQDRDTWALGPVENGKFTDIIAEIQRVKDGSWHWRIFPAKIHHTVWGSEPSRKEAMIKVNGILDKDTFSML